MLGVIQRPVEAEQDTDKKRTHTVFLRLDDEHQDMLEYLCRIGHAKKSKILRACLKHVYELEKGLDKSA